MTHPESNSLGDSLVPGKRPHTDEDREPGEIEKGKSSEGEKRE